MAEHNLQNQSEQDREGREKKTVGSLRDIVGKWIGQNWTTMESSLSILPVHLRTWLLTHLAMNNLLVDPLLHILAPEPTATVLGEHECSTPLWFSIVLICADLSWCRSVTETGLQGIGEACPQIQQLILRGTSVRFSPFLKR